MIFFENWESLGKTALLGVLAYGCLIFILRITGKRTLSKMNAFDLIVTVALGSTLATILVSRQTPLADGLVALVMLTCLQYAVAWSSVHSKWVRRIVKSEPTMLFYNGRFLEDQLRRERVVHDEILAAVRNEGIADLAKVEAVVLETDGSLSVIESSKEPKKQTVLANVNPRERT
ncbi:MAG: DUF421 domain-containing protein [Verrucomicrobia bacterium]|nr:DUF421 domain-containing protein [Verrucomicrobiota bacterium]